MDIFVPEMVFFYGHVDSIKSKRKTLFPRTKSGVLNKKQLPISAKSRNTNVYFPIQYQIL